MRNSTLSTLIVAEHDNQSLAAETLKTVSAAKSIGGEITMLVAGFQCQSVAREASTLNGVDNVMLADDEVYQHPLAENLSVLAADIGGDYSHILAAATTFGKNLMPRVAAMLDVGQLSDVIGIESEDIVIRPIYAGNALAKVKSTDPIKVLTIRSAAFDVAAAGGEPASITELDRVIPTEISEFAGQQIAETVRPELSAARVVISGGRGVGDKESFALIEKLADKLGGAIGASRAAVDAGFVSNDLQVGQTGKIVAPDLYIAVGISGAIQHLAGMKDSKVIVAINSDPDAPIFQIADYGLVGDLFEVVPELIEAL
ncbi:electron transfer flavoprotein subunit alpha/FixB family protein [Photobacterium lipolyticum]|uniref:Electron transfer flavoprotein subunit alpha n=1 Tax=Photobacterium lipolyticum TaxID=266810 RepID=A0A2T3MZJ2_9GAMM|nr:FAD-binding protein [Photobacterium lipolyticum]PSW05411.1 electron transfer flavoprotein subunit alpha [Photobacterium lipolyticum]